MKTTIDPDLQEAAVSALAGRSGGIAVLDTRSGDVRALAGQAFSAPQPPGSTFKMITTTAALQNGRRLARRRIRDHRRGQRRRPLHRQRQRRVLRRHLPRSLRRTPATPTSPRSGPKIGNDELVETAERFGFNSPPTLYAGGDRRRGRTAGVDDPRGDRRRPRPRRQRDRPGRGAGDAAADGERRPDDRQRRRARADLDRRQPEAAARRGAGAGDVGEDRRRTDRTDGRRRRRRHRLRRRRSPRPRSPARPAPPSSARRPARRTSRAPEQIKDAWFTAFAPAEKPRLAVAVLLIDAEAPPAARSPPRPPRRSSRPASERRRALEVERDLARSPSGPGSRGSAGGSGRRRRAARRARPSPRSGPARAVESSTGICSWASTSPPSGKRVEAFALERLEDLVVGVGDRELVGQRAASRRSRSGLRRRRRSRRSRRGAAAGRPGRPSPRCRSG